MVVFALILLFFANNQSPSVLFDSAGTEAATGGNYLPAFALGMFMALFVVYGFDTAGTFGEETVDASRQAPRGVLLVGGDLRARRHDLPDRGDPRDPEHARRDRRGPGARVPDRDDHPGDPDRRDRGRHHGRRGLPVRHPRVGLRLHAGDPGRRDPDDVLDEPRPAPAARLACGAASTRRFKTPANAAIAVGVLAAIPILVIGPLGGFSVSIAATGLIYLSYLLTNLGVLAARFRGWPHKPAWFNLGRWGKLVNILAILYGGLMLINIALWQDPGLFGDFGGEGRAITNPTIDTLHQAVRQ